MAELVEQINERTKTLTESTGFTREQQDSLGELIDKDMQCADFSAYFVPTLCSLCAAFQGPSFCLPNYCQFSTRSRSNESSA